MRKNKTMRGGFGFDLDTMKTLGRAGLNHAVNTGLKHAASAASNRRISAMNPKGVEMPANLLGFAKS